MGRKQMQEQTKEWESDLQKRPVQKTLTRKRPTKETYKRDLQKRHKLGNACIDRKQMQEQTKE